jgi:hypothetical protein
MEDDPAYGRDETASGGEDFEDAVAQIADNGEEMERTHE